METDHDKQATLADLRAQRETLWINPKHAPAEQALRDLPFGRAQLDDAAERLERFRPLLFHLFSDTRADGGRIESKLVPLNKEKLEETGLCLPAGPLFLKLDSHLPVSGSIKARGGLYEVLCLAERIAQEEGGFDPDQDHAVLAREDYRRLFSSWRIVVGSTGNLGLSVGIMGAALGFSVEVHMSTDARAWKKERLRARGVTVVEYPGDYGQAVAGARAQAANERTWFVDDETSQLLFFGYSVAALRLKDQLDAAGIRPDAAHPLHVHLPCGVGGGPGGIAWGLKLLYGDHVRCWFAEPVQAPCMLLGLASGRHETICVQDIGLGGRTDADGLAVGRPSGFVSRAMEALLDGAYTVRDQRLWSLLHVLHKTHAIALEPSALAGLAGPERVGQPGIHVVWATGGGMVPAPVMSEYLARAAREMK